MTSYVFAQPAILTVSAGSASKVYGADDTASLQAGYTVSGLQAGVAGAYLADTAAVTSGTPAVTSTGAAAAAGVGSYVIAAAAGSFTATNGYTVAFQNNTLTVTPVTLAYVANAAARTYGAANPAFSGNVTGFVNGDTLASATSGALAFASSATAGSGIGTYAINGSGLSAANYVFVQAASNATALTVNSATLSYTANSANPPLWRRQSGLQRQPHRLRQWRHAGLRHQRHPGLRQPRHRGKSCRQLCHQRFGPVGGQLHLHPGTRKRHRPDHQSRHAALCRQCRDAGRRRPRSGLPQRQCHRPGQRETS